MKRVLTLLMVVGLLWGLGACAGTGPVDRAKREISPMFGGTKSEVVWISAADEDPYMLRFAVEFEKPVKAAAFWIYPGATNVIRDGISIYDMDDLGYVKLFTLDMRTVKKETGSFGAPIELNLGYNNPISGYPSFHRIAIHENESLPEGERHKCFEATCLEIVVLKWNSEKQAFDVRYVHPSKT